MTYRFLGFAFAAAGLLGAAHAQDGLAPANSIRVSSAAEHLDNGTPTWTENSVGMQLRLRQHEALDLSAAQTRRFGLNDSSAAASYTLPLTASLTGTVEAAASPTHRVLAERVIGAGLQLEFAHAWLLHLGARNSSFDTASVNQGRVAIEHYFGNWSASAAWSPTRAYGRNASGAELRAGYYYGERNAVTLIAAGGQEAASVPGGVALTDVRSVALTGRHWFAPRWAATWAVSHTRQGNLYSRSGLTLGAQYAF
jgi:YaiO family outer membrane protein